MMVPDANTLNVSRETFERLKIFADLVHKWNPRINLVSKRSLEDLWTRHIIDSIQVFRNAPKGDLWVDLGSGGGFPGLICAILAAEEKPETQFICVESDQRKSAFLRSAARECGIACQVISERIEHLDPLDADILSARALTDLTGLLGFAERHLKIGGTALFPKGAAWKKELQDAAKQWNFSYDAVTSLTEPQAVLLKITGVTRV
ncbi:16S rRNA (guanine(527)-N(7))-methyltransferase RsmG [Ruegeria pomeroyi]|uniref:Ribosomal RNA small subunit methyltransferase G n=2 Tax=Ruegeria pomeroyi TaxID=89184 RepID=RSMG_RUEPO|nr:16S rRNA (guanine(527)-N(7))-methyltransferase RsmG [Ruegeria pomeroyi]Q5LWF2.1 RecName: Full=Ribosomal RNA small subunit methyltransferase G; AltName: Full=16S rRNA 7-methylguanosine methyltransferase; Short=16S rRNA m7G methyltransferase [Ruegeria pomeroyi DSS-3]HCE71062.1 16S rRNA (guanine(527)-N(7))-methyltransferase RsmG [Ruegeria sp.]AAV93333.1 glucose-inhibited division protein B [Ruegeria pomeroyi DSS-3]NVK96053.1 16S rRNA (guanine(527)-N(7))-methyltransferase RsmG [Ruegeria pomeroyi